MSRLYPPTTPAEPITRRGSWLDLPQSGKEKITAAATGRARSHGMGSPIVYEWTQEEPPPDYVGPMPYCSSVRIAGRRKTCA